jgi:6-phosphofructokinase 1
MVFIKKDDMGKLKFTVSKETRQLAKKTSIPLARVMKTGQAILDVCAMHGVDLSKNIAVGIDVNGPMVAVDNNDLVPMPFTRDCLEYLMRDAAIKPAVMTGWDMSSMAYFCDQLLKIPSVGAVCEYGMLFKNGDKIVNLYPSNEKEALDFLSVAIDLCAADGLKFAVQGNYSTAVGPLVVEADGNGNLLSHPLVKGRIPKMDDVYAVIKKDTACEWVDGRVYFENKPENLRGIYQAFARKYPLISARYRREPQRGANWVSCVLDSVDKPGFGVTELRRLGEQLKARTGRRVMVYEDFGVDSFTRQADEGNYFKQSGLHAFGKDVFGDDDFVEIIVGDKPNDAPKVFQQTLFCSLAGSEASEYAKEKKIVYCDVGDMRDFALALRDIRRQMGKGVKHMVKGNVIVGQSGGPTSVINASLAGVVTECRRWKKCIKNVYGMHFAIEGFMKGDLLDLGAESTATIRQLVGTPGSALGSCRYKLQDKDLPHVLEMFRRYDIRYFFLAGGNDTMDTIHRVEKYCRQNGYELCGVGIPKTVDNDLFGTDHTPGYPSAARYTALTVLHSGILARDMKKVDQFVVYQSIGRDAGWLTASAALARTKDPASAPHIILLPEIPFETEKFLAEVRRVYDRVGWVSIVCGEGVKYADGTPLSATTVKDKFGNMELGAMGGGSVGLTVHRIIREAFGWRGEFQITESLPMSAADRAVKMDLDEAFKLGREAVKLAVRGVTGKMVNIIRKKGKTYGATIGTVDLAEVAVHAKPMPRDFITEDGFFVTKKFYDYAAPLVGKMPEYAKLKARPVKAPKAKS